MSIYPAMCPICNCPIQVLYDAKKGETYGDIDLAMEAHLSVVHRDEPEVSA